MEGSQPKYRSHIDPVDSYIPIMMTSTITTEEEIASIKKMVEDMAKWMQRHKESLTHMAGKIHDHEQCTQAAEASLKSLASQEAPNTSKDTPETPLTYHVMLKVCPMDSQQRR
ncbi:hypothetical protein LIER_23798 [Lithospermum erythrorhizon]|uniref:Uncharacterized protein n=1 Tax=Lithospermum erythrorhizon TaxID=34254 RepID=A0AAV3R0A1_LITER